MLKAGANKGGTGENAIVQTSNKVDVIVGPLSILIANSMMGEMTPNMAVAVSSSEAKKIVIPLTQENVIIMGDVKEPLPHMVDQVVKAIQEMDENV